MSTITEHRAQASMKRPMMLEGCYFASRVAAIEYLLTEGYRPVHRPASGDPYRLEHPDGTFYSSRDITLTAWRYAAEIAGTES